MTLQEYCNGLKKTQQFQLAIALARSALPIWTNYATNNELIYRDTVVGMMHEVPKTLLPDTINAVEEYLARRGIFRKYFHRGKLFKLSSYYDDPKVALQDLDWEPPRKIYTDSPLIL